MKTGPRLKTSFFLILVGAAIPLTLVLSNYINIPTAFTIIAVIILGITFCSMALWAFANRKATGSEWWQDDTASGWRGY